MSFLRLHTTYHFISLPFVIAPINIVCVRLCIQYKDLIPHNDIKMSYPSFFLSNHLLGDELQIFPSTCPQDIFNH